ncbi:MAG: hypothetical protein AB8G16_13980 [Gammaproteobacteria bacterium]
MANSLRRLFLIAFVFCSASAKAVSVYMVTTGPLAVDNDTFLAVEGATYNIEIWMDFTADRTLGGGYDVVFNEGAFDFVEWESAGLGEEVFARTPEVFDGLLESAAVGDFNGLSGPDLMATATFVLTDLSVLTQFGSMTTAATAGIGGPWVSAVDFICCQKVDFFGVDFVTPVPVPAAIWLFLGGLGWLFGLTRTQRD